jgi:hypothetical protein
MAARVSQTGLLVVEKSLLSVRVSQTGLLAVEGSIPKARVSQTGLLVIAPNAAPPVFQTEWASPSQTIGVGIY